MKYNNVHYARKLLCCCDDDGDEDARWIRDRQKLMGLLVRWKNLSLNYTWKTMDMDTDDDATKMK